MRLTGVISEPGVGGTEPELPVWEWVAENGADGARMLRPPHFAHFGLSPADPGASDERLLRLPLRFG